MGKGRTAQFLFQSTRNILCEVGSSGRVGELMAGMGCRNVLVVTDPGVAAANLLEPALASFSRNNIRAHVFADVVPDPPESIVDGAVAAALEQDVQGVVGLGGGSSMDVAKLVSFLVPSDQILPEVYGVGLCKGSRLPLVQVPTTAGTGSEVTPISIVTTGESEKKGVVSPVLLPDWAVLDPNLTLSLPAHATAVTGIDAMVHAIEAFTSKVKKNPLSDCLAREALSLLAANIRTACSRGTDLAARTNMLLGSLYAGMAFANAPVAAVHALAYPIGTHFHVSHGLSNSLMLPHVLRFNAPNAAPLYADLAPVMFPKEMGGGNARDPVEVAEEFAGLVEGLCHELCDKTRLRDVGVDEGSLEFLAQEAMKQTRLLPNNPREVTLEDARALYRRAW